MQEPAMLRCAYSSRKKKFVETRFLEEHEAKAAVVRPDDCATRRKALGSRLLLEKVEKKLFILGKSALLSHFFEILQGKCEQNMILNFHCTRPGRQTSVGERLQKSPCRSPSPTFDFSRVSEMSRFLAPQAKFLDFELYFSLSSFEN